MPHTLFIEVSSEHTSDRYVVFCATPVHIGKAARRGNQILLDPEETISRAHGVIHAEGAGLVYEDTSKNGSIVAGGSVHQANAPLAKGWTIGIGPQRLREVSVPSPLVLSHLSATRKLIRQRHVLDGHGVGIRAADDGLRLVDLNKWSERGRPLVARVQMARGGIIVGRGTHIAARELRLNHRPLTEKITLAPEASVIDLPEWRFEVCSAGTHAVACGGATCGLLNVAPVGKAGNCRWCGRDFAGTGADTVLFDSPDALAWREA